MPAEDAVVERGTCVAVASAAASEAWLRPLEWAKPLRIMARSHSHAHVRGFSTVAAVVAVVAERTVAAEAPDTAAVKV